jgi:hypothetical protein
LISRGRKTILLQNRLEKGYFSLDFADSMTLDANEIVDSLGRVETFGDLLAWAYVPIKQSYAEVADYHRHNLDSYSPIWNLLRDAIAGDILAIRYPERAKPFLTLKRIRSLREAGTSLELILHAVLTATDREVVPLAAERRLINGPRKPLNSLHADKVRIFDRRNSIRDTIKPTRGNPDLQSWSQLNISFGGPSGASDEAYALAPHTCFLETDSDYAQEVIAVGWQIGREPVYRSLRVICDCVVDSAASLEWGVGAEETILRSLRSTKKPFGRITKTFGRVQRSTEATCLNLVAFPELTIDEELLGRALAVRPRHALVVHGSRHRQDDSTWRNTSTITLGDSHWTVDKLTAYRSRDSFEAISVHPRTVVLADTPMGRVVVLICKDFLSLRVLQMLETAGPALVIIPSMTPSGVEDLFLPHAAELATRSNSIVLLANTCSLMRHSGRSDLSKVGFLLYPEANAPPTIHWYGCRRHSTPALVVDH